MECDRLFINERHDGIGKSYFDIVPVVLKTKPA
jgi:hypothetical protein